MDKREFETRIKALHKAANVEPPAVIVSQLGTIRDQVVATEELLRTTRAGLIVGKLRSNQNKDIARAASEVVAKWKKAVEAEKRAKGNQSGPVLAPKVAGSISPANKKSASPAPQALGSKKEYKGDPETRTFKSDKIGLDRTGSQVRNNCIGLLYNGLAYRSREPEDAVLVRAQEIEHAAYKAYNGETKEYKEKIRSLFQNLKVKTNAELGRNLMSGAIPAERFVVMTSKELMSAEQRKTNAELEEENMKKAQVPMAEKSISDTLECSGCKKKMVSYTQAQTRSADEPMTTFCECMNCGKRWKFS
ncbi:transcription elongation factor [Xylariaceae sp. FL0804]|nr:transcription elongation factor [Xylariaceae sp. FL0804]